MWLQWMLLLVPLLAGSTLPLLAGPTLPLTGDVYLSELDYLEDLVFGGISNHVDSLLEEAPGLLQTGLVSSLPGQQHFHAGQSYLGTKSMTNGGPDPFYYMPPPDLSGGPPPGSPKPHLAATGGHQSPEERSVPGPGPLHYKHSHGASLPKVVLSPTPAVLHPRDYYTHFGQRQHQRQHLIEPEIYYKYLPRTGVNVNNRLLDHKLTLYNNPGGHEQSLKRSPLDRKFEVTRKPPSTKNPTHSEAKQIQIKQTDANESVKTKDRSTGQVNLPFLSSLPRSETIQELLSGGWDGDWSARMDQHH